MRLCAWASVLAFWVWCRIQKFVLRRLLPGWSGMRKSPLAMTLDRINRQQLTLLHARHIVYRGEM